MGLPWRSATDSSQNDLMPSDFGAISRLRSEQQTSQPWLKGGTPG